MKLSFIDGTNMKIDATDPSFEHWIRVDSLVTILILNSISKELVEGFMYTKAARKRLMDLEQSLVKLGRVRCVDAYDSVYLQWLHCGASKAATDLASFMQSSHDHCLFLKAEDGDFLALLVYVDAILLTGTSLSLLEGVKSYLDKLFIIKDLGHAKYFLGLELARSQHGLHVSQSKFLRGIFTDFGMLDCKPVSTPLPSVFLRFRVSSSSPDHYRHLVGGCCTWVSPSRYFFCGTAAQSISSTSSFHSLGCCHECSLLPQRDQFKLGFISPSYMPGKDQVVDFFTKSLSALDFTRLLVKLGMVPPAPPLGGL
ncbi:UNVERIFIED_CONTAM: putative mitochondrial protein [Sesamum calycinum]|uniref:Mitochondrial protein n=1 Tax=Sesamum calycinum TaxID=2727403 RepID=A0AAW2JA12_9LAMI